MAKWSLFPRHCSRLAYITKATPTFSLPGQGATSKQSRRVQIQSLIESELDEPLITVVLIKQAARKEPTGCYSPAEKMNLEEDQCWASTSEEVFPLELIAVFRDHTQFGGKEYLDTFQTFNYSWTQLK